MKILMITGDKRFGPGNPRFDLQKSAVEKLAVVYWGRGSYWPALPPGEFDVVTSQDAFWRGLFAWHVARRVGVRLNVQVHADLFGQSFAKRCVARLVLQRANSIRVVSEKIKQQVAAIAPRASVQVLPVFINCASFRAIVREPHEQKTILWVGRFEEEKNPRAAIDVLKEVLTTTPDAHLIMLGAGSKLEELQKAARGLAVEFPGWQDPKAFLARADVVVCTSWHESFGASIIETLAAGVPVVAPDVGVAKEAGAIVVTRTELAGAVGRVLKEATQGHLALRMPTAEEWKHLWQKTL